MRLSHSAQNKITRNTYNKKCRFVIENIDSKAAFLVEILTNFNFNVCFLAAFWLSAVLLYGDENQTTTSAS